MGANTGTFNDTRISADEFEIDYSNGILAVTNTEGRDLVVEEFSSEHGKITVLDGLHGSENLSNTPIFEVRLERGFGTKCYDC